MFAGLNMFRYLKKHETSIHHSPSQTLIRGHVECLMPWSPCRGLSKVLAEETAWKMSREPDCPFQLTVLLPTLIWGPMVPGQPHLNTSASSLVGYMDGSIQEGKPSTASGTNQDQTRKSGLWEIDFTEPTKGK